MLGSIWGLSSVDSSNATCVTLNFSPIVFGRLRSQHLNERQANDDVFPLYGRARPSEEGIVHIEEVVSGPGETQAETGFEEWKWECE